jgi:hypothetical protein
MDDDAASVALATMNSQGAVSILDNGVYALPATVTGNKKGRSVAA